MTSIPEIFSDPTESLGYVKRWISYKLSIGIKLDFVCGSIWLLKDKFCDGHVNQMPWKPNDWNVSLIKRKKYHQFQIYFQIQVN